MKIKLQHSIFEYKYLVMFDLASHITGVCVWDIQNNIPLTTSVIETNKNAELPAADLYNHLDLFFHQLNEQGIKNSEILVYQEAMPTQIKGGGSTVQTFLSLARSHSILDLYTYKNNIAVYDYIGIYPISTHAYLKKIRGWDNKHKVEKIDIRDYIEEEYKLMGLTYDESDAVFLAKTFIDIKWNKDIDEAIKAVRKHSKELKSERGINTCLEEIKRLEGLKIKKGGE